MEFRRVLFRSPFYGLHARLTQLIEGHEDGLSKPYDMLAEPKRAIDVFPALFKREIGPEVFFMANGESLAPLNSLLDRKAATVERNEKGETERAPCRERVCRYGETWGSAD